MVLVFRFAGGEKARDIRLLVPGTPHHGVAVVVGLVVDPQAAHGVVHPGEDPHGHFPRIVADELLVDLEDPAQLPVQRLLGDVADVQVDHILAIDPHLEHPADVEDLARRDVPRDEILVFRVFLFQEVPWCSVLGNPDAATLRPGRLAHESHFVLARDGGGVHLDELAVGEERSLLVDRRGCRAGTDHRVRALPEDHPQAARGETDGIGGERADLHAAEVLTHDAPAESFLVLDGRQKLPELELLHQPCRLVFPHLFVQGIEELLARRRPGERRPAVQRAAEPPEVQQALRRSVEGHPHPVQEVHDPGGRLAHPLGQGLVGQKIPAFDRLVEMDLRAVPFPFGIDGGVDPALGADRVGALDRHEGEELTGQPGLCQLDDRHQAGQAAPDDDGSGPRSHDGPSVT